MPSNTFLSANFEEPETDDPTSAPPIPQQQNTTIPQLLSKQKKKNPRNPAALARLIASASRARQGKHRYG